MTVSVKAPTSTTGSIQLNGSDVLTIDSSGITLATGKDLTLSSTALDASASGIYLGGTASANLLDDYEEGTWTPEVNFSGGTVGITYISRTGTYRKVGNLVTIGFNVALSSKGSSVGSLRIGGIPFNGLNEGIEYHSHPYLVTLSHSGNLTCYIPTSGLYISFVDFTDAGSPAFLKETDVNNTSILRGSLFYYT